jgi:hypothetical protein
MKKLIEFLNNEKCYEKLLALKNNEMFTYLY